MLKDLTVSLSCLVFVPNFNSMNTSSLSRRRCIGDHFTPTPRQLLRCQITSVGIELIELTVTSDSLNYNPYFKHCILQTNIYAYCSCLYLREANSDVLQTDPQNFKIESLLASHPVMPSCHQSQAKAMDTWSGFSVKDPSHHPFVNGTFHTWGVPWPWGVSKTGWLNSDDDWGGTPKKCINVDSEI